MAPRTCPQCSGPLPLDAHGNARYCSRTCSQRAFNDRRKADGRLEALNRRQRERKAEFMKANRAKCNTRPCATCGETFQARGGGTVHCDPCRSAAKATQAANQAARRQAQLQAREAREAAREAQRQAPRRIWHAGQCRRCAAWYTTNQPHANYCTKTCARRDAADRYDAARGRFKISPRRRLSLYERDGWTCQLCGDPVDPSLDPLDKYAATLDHIEPQARALIPDHSDANLRLAHRICNSYRRDGVTDTAA